MRWGSIMTAVCYDVLNQVLFDKTVLSTSVFIVSPVSPSTKAGWWYVSVLVPWGVWGSALEWPAHLSGPRAEAARGYRITRQAKSQYQAFFILLSRSNLFRQNVTEFWWESVHKTTTSRENITLTGLFVHVADFHEWERASCLSNVGGRSLFKPEDSVTGWHVWFFPAVKRVLSEGGWTPGFPPCHQWSEWTVTLTSLNGL